MPIDPAPHWLTDEHKAQLATLRAERAIAQDPQKTPLAAAGGPTWLLLGVWALATYWLGFGWVFPIVGVNGGTREERIAAVIVLLVFMFGGIAVVISVAVSKVRTWRAGQLEAIDARINTLMAEAEASRLTEHDYGSLPDTRRSQHLWYEDHRELDWQDRVIGEMYGLDVDTYINNFKEHDPN